jgi:NAD(P)-dependent dehydrogenase (short-subunit alcohol dehydrogenase family)
MTDVVIVTGASSGIGAATARLLGAAGASVVVNYRSSRERAAASAPRPRACWAPPVQASW